MSGDAVTQAREAVDAAITRFGDRDASHDEWVLAVAALDAYAAALLAAERQRVVGMVEALKYDTRVEGYNGFEASVWNGALSTVAARLTGGE
jgi:hypothetical protein